MFVDESLCEERQSGTEEHMHSRGRRGNMERIDQPSACVASASVVPHASWCAGVKKLCMWRMMPQALRTV